MKFKTYMVLSATFLVAAAEAQTIGSDLEKVRNTYLGNTHFSADVAVTGYKTPADVTGFSIGKGMLRKSGNNYYSKFQSEEMIVNEHCTMIIDHDAKSMTWFHGTKLSGLNNTSNLPPVDSLLKNNDTVIYRGEKEGMKCYSFLNSRSYISETEIYVDPKTWLVRRIVYFYREQNKDETYDVYRVVINYSNLSTSKPDQGFFSEKKYVNYKQGKPVLLPSFTSYSLEITNKESLK